MDYINASQLHRSIITVNFLSPPLFTNLEVLTQFASSGFSLG